MEKVYGKKVDMRYINRNLCGIKKLIDECQCSAEKYDLNKQAEREQCIVCGSKNRYLFLTLFGKYNYYECEKCQCLTLNLFPDPVEMYNTDESENLGLYIDSDTYNQRVNMIVKPKVDFVINTLKRIGINPKSWLDIGSGGGELLYYLKDSGSGINGVGIETDKSEVKFCSEMGLKVYDNYIDIDNISDEITKIISANDVVSSFNVLEHIEKPVQYIEYLYNSMNVGTYLVLEVPKHPSLASFANLTSRGNVYRHIIPPIHLQIFSKHSLEILLKGMFEIVASWEFGQGFSDVINNAMILADVKECKLYEQILNKQNRIQQAIDEAGLADQILLIASRI